MEKGEAKSKKPARLCCICNERRPVLKRPKTLQQICRECFYEVFEEEIHQAIVKNRLFKSGERVAIGASGGKDSTVLAYVLSELNRRHSYGLDLFLLSIDEGITGYRDDSLETVKRNELQTQICVHVRARDHAKKIPFFIHQKNMGANASLAAALIVGFALLFAVTAESPYRFFEWNVTYGDIYPLGVRQQGILINGQFPGPDIHSVTNDNLIINVYNSLDEPFLLSW
ncbi:hypothetical protein F2Q70_00045511 [Brassica cretica]|uniref:Plastocyanin-like domain-containing protein n=1 Tax=Brassica cretica TaxID=69181 RepID=A0A8S9KLJ3_BRACR|nr:hypothetical protein F2Q70_00045511 [Brassica cretica]